MKRLFSSVFLFVSSICFSHECCDFADEFSEAIEGYTTEKIYLKPEKIFTTQEGIFLQGDTFFAKLDALYSDAEGCFVISFEDALVFSQCQNPKCKNVWAGTYKRNCPKCGSPGKVLPY